MRELNRTEAIDRVHATGEAEGMKLLDFGGVSLMVEEFGEYGSPPVVLIAGATQSMDWWSPKFCELLAAEGLHVIRYDHRDTGQSTTSAPGRPGYTGADLATDPLRILDALGIVSAHLVGLSMGGGIAQYLGAHASERIQTLTLIESSPIGGDRGELPPPDGALSAAEAELPEVNDWADTSAVIDYRVEAERPYAGSFGFDEERVRGVATIECHRSRNMESSMTNHFLVPDDIEADPSTISIPTLIVHSDSDPLFPLLHGEALARMIPHAVLLRADGMGHEAPPPRVWNIVVPAILDHVRGHHHNNDSEVRGPDE